MGETPLPRNIVEEFDYITEAVEGGCEIPQSLVYSIIKELEVYQKTGDKRRAVEMKEAYRIAFSMKQQGYSDSERLMEAAELFERKEYDKSKAIWRDVVRHTTKSYNTEVDAIRALI